jgi:hypothetical protein
MKRILHIKRTTKKWVRTLPGDDASGGRPRRVVVTKRVTTARRRTLR